VYQFRPEAGGGGAAVGESEAWGAFVGPMSGATSGQTAGLGRGERSVDGLCLILAECMASW